jgi:hypothetical protein
LERSIAKEDETARESLNVQQAYVILQRCMEKDDVDAAVKTYYSVVNSFGNGADIVFFHEVVQPFVEYLLKNERPSEAVQAVGRARKVMRVEPRAQLDVEMSALMDRAQALSR